MSDMQEETDGPQGGGVQTIAQPILDKLNQFDVHTRRKQTCLECGYVGIMGIEEELHPWWLSWWCIALITVVGAIFMGAGFVIGGVLVLLRYFGEFDTRVLVCPNCEEAYEQD